MKDAGESRSGRHYGAAVRALYDHDLSHDISREALATLLTEAGIGPRLAESMADDVLLDLKLQPAGFAMNDIRVALTASIVSLATILPDIWFRRLLQENPELRQPPTEDPPVTVTGAGIVHRGKTTVTTGTVPRDYFWIWLQRDPNADCPEFRWYQFVRPRLFVDGVDVGADDTIPAATGLPVTFGEWNPDYHAGPARQEARDRHRAGQPPLPDFTPELPPDTPGGQPPRVRPGKPYVETPVAGAHGVTGATSTGPHALGVLDSPNFNERPAPTHASSIEDLWRKNTRSDGTGQTHPAPDSGVEVAEVRVEVRTYLVCIRGATATCIGYVSWSSVSRARIQWEWRQVVEAVPEMGISGTNAHWRRFPTHTDFTLSQTMGGWSAC